LDKLERIRAVLPDVAFTTDVIVGFPGETAAEFEETLETCRQAQFMKIHCFPFSTRKGTPAAAFPDQVPPEVRRERMQRLAVLERTLAQRYYASMIGRTLEVLVERVCDDRAGWVRGTDRHYIPVVLPGEVGDVGRCVFVRGTTAHVDYLEAQP
jgi:threonylcarbamoyladenosine tRNA methylthiotransferase MtaB